MNVFRNRKKSMAEADGERPSFDKPPPMPASRSKTIFRKKQQAEPKPEIDIATVLPSTDDFRTSLLMPNLSARFSMLREQDDPKSKIGKASDDSVLFPNRASKMGLSLNGLSDIAEVASINGSIRPPFANERDGYSSDNGYGTDEDPSAYNGNIMDRAKPGQGNKFFGGRQKVYMIPQDGAGSTRDLTPGAQDRPAGKPVYQEDISMSVFQALRAKEKLERKLSEENREAYDDRDDRSSREHERDAKRATSSSTNSNPREGRISTAATSIASQGGIKPSTANNPGQERVGQKKRLYGHGLDQQIHDQQSSAMNRLNSIQRPAGFPRNGNGSLQSRSATSLHDKFRSSSPFSPALPSGTPSPQLGFGGFDFGPTGRTRSGSRDTDLAKQTPPMSPNGSSPVDPTLVAALEPNDLGKATASGAFNKPKTAYSEEQFAQRQLQLQEDRNTPPLRSMSREDMTNDHYNRLRNGSIASMRSQTNRPYPIDTSRAPSNASNRHAVLITPDPSNGNGAFLDFSDSEYESSPDSPEPRKSSDLLPSDIQKVRENNYLEHADHRLPSEGIDSRVDARGFMDPTASTPSSTPEYDSRPEQDLVRVPADTSAPRIASPANLGNLGGLNDLVRGHLRSDSGASSVYDADQSFQNERPSYDQPRQALDRANQFANAPAKVHDVLGGMREDKVQKVLGGEAPRRSNESAHGGWQDQLKMGHARGGSTETQKEREDFANELAERRRAVQDNLMRMEETSRASSPAKNPDSSPVRNGAFGLLKKPSRGGGMDDQPTKAMKMLGMPSGAMNRSPPQSNEPSVMRSRTMPHIVDSDHKAQPGSERNIAAERRERFFRKGSAPAQAQKFEQQPNARVPLPPGNHGFSTKSASEQQPMSFYPAGRSRKYSPPSTKAQMVSAPASAAPPRPKPSPDTLSPVLRSSAFQQPTSYFPPDTPDSGAGGFTSPPTGSPRPSPSASSFSTNTTTPLDHPYQPPGTRPRNRSVSKREISEPTFVSGSSSVTTINLPPGASLQNGMASPPPLPPINPNRRRGRAEITQNMLTAFGAKSFGASSSPPPERSVWESDSKQRSPRARLRKSSSDGGNIAAKARHQALMREVDSIPNTPNLPTQQSFSGRSSRKNSESRMR